MSSIEGDLKKGQRDTRDAIRNETPVSALSTYLSMPNLVACWDMRSTDYERRIVDHSGQGRSLEYMVGYTQNSGISPYTTLTNAQWLFRYSDMSLQITGAMTACTWIRMTADAAGTILGRWYTTNNQRVWSFSRAAGGAVQANECLTGAAATSQAAVSSKLLAVGTWGFLALRFTPGTELAIFHNMTKDTLAAGVNASMYAGYPKFCINGRDWGTAAMLAFDVGITAMYSYALSDASIFQLFQSSRGWYGA